MQIAADNTVFFHYSLLGDKGEVIETSREQEPLSFIVGQNQIVPGLEKSMLGKSAGDKFQVKIKSADGYGDWLEEKVYDVSLEVFEGVEELAVGLMCQLTNEQNEQELVCVVEINDTVVTVDSNHPYAGLDIKFSVEIIDVK
ncbi:peptidylprolyl isomerase [Gammaproteobacteria bacterium AS21]|jgi:FKBP-type peptidyl-prolyl cis-trans isomerase SlyD